VGFFFHTVLTKYLTCFYHFILYILDVQKNLHLDIRQLIASKNKAKRQADKSHDSDDRRCFQQLKNELKTSIRQAKDDYLQTLKQRSRTDSARAADVCMVPC